MDIDSDFLEVNKLDVDLLRQSVISTIWELIAEPDFPYIEALAPYQPLAMKVGPLFSKMCTFMDYTKGIVWHT